MNTRKLISCEKLGNGYESVIVQMSPRRFNAQITLDSHQLEDGTKFVTIIRYGKATNLKGAQALAEHQKTTASPLYAHQTA
jgi:predicted RNase H-related nuclease YkuK (DUF458 family)